MNKVKTNNLLQKKKTFKITKTSPNSHLFRSNNLSYTQKQQKQPNLLLKSRTWKSNLIVTKKDENEFKSNIQTINARKKPVNTLNLMSTLTVGKQSNNPRKKSLTLKDENFTQINESDDEPNEPNLQEGKKRDLIKEIIEKDGTDIAIHLYILERLNKISLVIEQFNYYLNKKQEKDAKYLAEIIVSIFLELEYLTPYAESQVADTLGLYDENIKDEGVKQNIREECENLSLKNYFVTCSHYSLQIAEGLWKYLNSKEQSIHVLITERIDLLKGVIETSKKKTSLFIDLLGIDIDVKQESGKNLDSSLELNGISLENENTNAKPLEEINNNIFKNQNMDLKENKKFPVNKRNISKPKRFFLPPPPNYPPNLNY
ncbi:hypothetical protein M0812_05016 [Anaeramoeba flamelloides]|uniref:Uncharacterized protein n=1 Tax=Anaeramoeba flamelloides TaxID=1746091 RepID=A0AAV8AEI9_9EUKA|nr:hypothetical protein M0812_05016 [Anaeramoeba flamelloides]